MVVYTLNCNVFEIIEKINFSQNVKMLKILLL